MELIIGELGRESRKVYALERIADALETHNALTMSMLTKEQFTEFNEAYPTIGGFPRDELHTSNRVPTSDD